MIEFVLNGTLITSPPEWDGMSVSVNFENTVQGDVDIDALTFGFDALPLIDNWISSSGFFRGMPLEIRDSGFVFFQGFLDFNKKYEVIHNGKRIIGIEKDRGINQLSDFVNSFTFGLLSQKASLNFYKIPYLVERKNNFLAEALISVTNLLILKEIYENIRRLAISINKFIEALPPLPANVGALIVAGLQILIDIAYTVLMVVAYKRIIGEFLNSLISPIRYHDSIRLDNTLQQFFNLKYNGFQTGINELSEVYYFPSKNEDSRSTGIPNATDYGYLLGEFIQLVETTFNAKILIDENNVVQLRSENDPYLVRNSTYTMPDILIENKEYNTNELVGTRNISFSTDVQDEWTIEEFKGTAYDVYTDTTNASGTDLIKGLDRVRIEACLGSRKNELNKIEKALQSLAQLADSLINALGGNSNLRGRITRRVGMIKVSGDTWAKPKLLRLNSSLNLVNNRLNWSAKYLYNAYYNYKSFVVNNNGYQRRIFEEQEIPFCLEDFKKVVNNSYFVDNFGAVGKFTSLKMEINKGKAVASWWVEEVYDKNLIETYVEP